ncbi:protein translocase subunit SecD [Patescibacteria group bacterium]|nr:protein translocase subunit SecD [Patescibacteria group bacterium]
MQKNNQKTITIFWSIIAVTFLCLIVNLPLKFSLFGKTFYRPDFSLNLGPYKFKPNLDLRYGLDLAGGASLIYDIDTSGQNSENIPDALESLKANIESRVNLFGVSEASVQISSNGDSRRLTVDLPGVANIDEAIGLIGQTAQLSFMGIIDLPPEATATATMEDVLKDTGLKGSHLVKATPSTNPNTGEVEVSLEFNSEGTKLFEKATTDYLNKRLAILLDNQIITAPQVGVIIPDGRAVINGNFDIKSAKALSAQLNAGALPLPINLIQQSQVGASLGQNSINKGLKAGLVGLAIVSLFMIGNYGFLGLVADFGLIVYGLITLTLYRLIPVTLTFPGIVGFILSVGMAVDSNILIFERMKEEIRSGKSWNNAMELGFGRAWNSIKDANTCTIITGLILFNPFNWSFLNSSGMVRGFAVTLLLGIVLGMFTGVFVTRNLLRVLARKNNN